MESSLLHELLSAKKIYLWGAASAGHRVLFRLINLGVNLDNITFLDSNYSNLSPILGHRVLSPSVLTSEKLDDTVILVSSTIKTNIIDSASSEIRSKLRYVHELIFSRDVLFKYPGVFIDFISQNSEDLNLDIDEAFTLWSAITQNNATPGMILEIGVYKGASLQLMATAVKNSENRLREIIGIDTFEGIPALSGNGDEKFENYLSDVEFEDVQHRIGADVQLIKGFFPDCVNIRDLNQIFLLHLDVDTFQTTKSALDLLWSKISIGGFVVVHDYNSQGCPGVKSAVDGLLINRQIVRLEVGESQVVLVKIAN